MARFHQVVLFSTVQYCNYFHFHCQKLWMDNSVGAPRTVVHYLKGGARFTAECWLVDRESSLACATRGMTTTRGMKRLLNSAMLLMRVGLIYIRMHKHKNITVYFIILYFYAHTVSRLFEQEWWRSILSGIHHAYPLRVLLAVETKARSGCTVLNHTVLYCTIPLGGNEALETLPTP